MMAVTHVVVGATCWAVAAKGGGLPLADPQALAAAAFGALLPDIDHPQSWAGRRFRLISVPLAAVIGHRGLTHSLLAVLGGLAVLAAMGMDWGAAPLVVGYLSHLLADGLTPSGVPLLWPSRRRFALPMVTTGSVLEMAFLALVTLLAGWLLGIDPSHLPRPRF